MEKHHDAELVSNAEKERLEKERLKKIHNTGYRDGHKGFSRGDNPYPERTPEADAWEEGWFLNREMLMEDRADYD